MSKGYRQTWRPPPTIDDYMFEVQQNIWWGQKERAKRQLLWIMEIYLGLGEDNGEGSFREIESDESEETEGEDGSWGNEGVDCH